MLPGLILYCNKYGIPVPRIGVMFPGPFLRRVSILWY